MADQEYARARARGQRKRTRLCARGRWGAAHPIRTLLAAGPFVLAACTVPDHPPLLPDALPDAAVESLRPREIKTVSSAPGLAYFRVSTDEEPWAIHLLRLELDRCELGLRVVRAPLQEGMAGGLSTVSGLVAGEDGPTVLAGVNGDFFTPEGLPIGTEVVAGEVRRVGPRPALAWRPGAPPWMGNPRTLGDSLLNVGWYLSRTRSDGITQVVGGFPLLLHGGERVGDLRVADLPAFAAARHPRTAVGYDAAGNLLWLVVVDGRQKGYSEGMTLPELASLMDALGATDAINLDGGGSSVMVLEGFRVSRPSDETGERPVVNALGVIRDASLCAETR